MEKIILTKEQLLVELDVAENTLRAMIEHNGFPHPRKMRQKLFWLVAEVVEWLSACPRAWGAGETVDKEKGLQ